MLAPINGQGQVVAYGVTPAAYVEFPINQPPDLRVATGLYSVAGTAPNRLLMRDDEIVARELGQVLPMQATFDSPRFEGVVLVPNRLGVGSFTPSARLPFASNMVLDGLAMGASGSDVVGHAFQTTVMGDFRNMGGPNPGLVFGTNIFTQTGTAPLQGVNFLYGGLGEVDIKTASGTLQGARGFVGEAAFAGAAAGSTITSMISMRAANPKRKDGATGGIGTSIYSLYVDPAVVGDVGSTNAFALYAPPPASGLAVSRFVGRLEANAGTASAVPLVVRSFATSPTGNFFEAWDAIDTNRKARLTKDGLWGVNSSIIAAEGNAQVTIGAHGPGSEAAILFGATGAATDTTFGYRAAATVIRHPHFHQYAQFVSFIETTAPAVAADRAGVFAFDVSGKTQLRVAFSSGATTTVGEQDGPADFIGSGSPEGVITAPIGSHYKRRDGGAGSSFYVKESNSAGNTGWVAK